MTRHSKRVHILGDEAADSFAAPLHKPGMPSFHNESPGPHGPNHHSHTLKSIQLTGSARSIPIEYFVQIANSCLHLKTLRCEYGLSLASFRTNGKQLVKFRWNCQGLRRLRVRWRHPPVDWPEGYCRRLLKYMGKQIGRLANLKELEIDGKDLASLQYGRLGLRDLRQLHTLLVLDTFKDVKWSAEDAEWMLEHWPRLVRIEGREGDHLAEATLAREAH